MLYLGIAWLCQFAARMPPDGRSRASESRPGDFEFRFPTHPGFHRVFLHADRDLKRRFERARRNRKSLSDRQRLFSKRVHLLSMTGSSEMLLPAD
jgi:hypothetical protein